MFAMKLILVTLVAAATIIVGQNVSVSPMAQVAPPTPTTMAIEVLIRDLVNVLGPLGFLGWYLYHSTSKVLPRKDEQMLQIVQNYMLEAEKSRAWMSAEVDLIQKACKEEVAAVLAEWRSYSALTNERVLKIVENCATARRDYGMTKEPGK
jgi:hypothetical protein